MAGNKHIYKGVQFDSDWELYVFNILEKMNFKTTPHPGEFLINEAFEVERLNGKNKKIRKMVYSPDFIIEAEWLKKPIIIDTKHGIITKDFMIRKKCFLVKYAKAYYYEEINNEKELQELIREIEKQRGNK